MRKLLIGIMASALMIMTGAAAEGASTSVEGQGSYDKLVVNNGDTNLVFKIHAPGGKCEIKYLKVAFRDRDGTRFAMDGGCYPGPTWAASLVKGGDRLIDCGGLTLKFNADKSVWTGTIPRSCLNGLGGAIKVTESYVDDYTPNINDVPATRYVAKG
jgi:hypothetical protein